MANELFDLYSMKVGEPGWAIKYCLNRFSELNNLKSVLCHLLVDGGIGGDIEWGIHKWDEYTEEDYGVSKFNGYRFYVGEKEHAIAGFGDIEEYASEERLKELLAPIIQLKIINHLVDESEIRDLADRLDIKI